MHPDTYSSPYSHPPPRTLFSSCFLQVVSLISLHNKHKKGRFLVEEKVRFYVSLPNFFSLQKSSIWKKITSTVLGSSNSLPHNELMLLVQWARRQRRTPWKWKASHFPRRSPGPSLSSSLLTVTYHSPYVFFLLLSSVSACRNPF
jgi:hypothetical protein